MGFFGSGKSYYPSDPEAPVRAPGQPPKGSKATEYRVNGMFDAEGNFYVPRRLILELSNGRTTSRPGDTIMLTRQEAQVVSKRTSITPVVEVTDG